MPRHDGAVGVRATTGPPATLGREADEQSPAEPEVFAVLFDRYAADIHHYAARRLGASAADDLVAETFLAAFRRRTLL
jgi:RNA polymerase sigma-70 factor, ECF subfamily